MADGTNCASPSNGGMLTYAEDNSTLISENGLNDADGLLFSELSYIIINTDKICEYGGKDISLNSGQSMTIGELYSMYQDHPDIFTPRTHDHENDMQLLANMANSKRFSDVQISNYCEDPVKNNDPLFASVGRDDRVEQFAAITLKYEGADGNTHNYFSFRGTNDTYQGWSEDFEMVYSGCTQAQLDSVAYANIVGAQTAPNERFDFGGHSKGGNDGTYSFLYCDQYIADRTDHIYGYDSPGQNREALRGTDRYDRYLELSEGSHICPQDSYVGQLLHENENSRFIHSTESGTNEHNPYSWEINKDGDFTPDRQSFWSQFADDVLDTAVPTLSHSECVALFDVIDCIYDVKYAANPERTVTKDEILYRVLNTVKNIRHPSPALSTAICKLLVSAGLVGGADVANALLKKVTGGKINLDNLSDFIDDVRDTIDGTVNAVKDGIDNTVNGIKDGVHNAIENGKEFLESINPFSGGGSSSGGHGGGGHHRSGGGSGSGGGILSGVMNKLREDFNVLRHGADDLLGYDIVLDEEAFAKAASDFEDLADQIKQLRKDIEEQLEMLQHGFDTPAGHKFIDSCRNNLLRPLEEQQIVVEHISETLHKCINEYQSVFNEYSELTALIASD